MSIADFVSSQVAGWFERRAEARSVERARSARREAAESAEAAAALRAACRDAVSETVSALAEGVSDLQINNKRLTEQFASTNSQCRLNSPRRRSPSILLHDVPVDPAKRLHWHGGSLATYDDLHGSLVVGEQGSKPHETGVVKFGPLVSYDYFGLVKGACDLKVGCAGRLFNAANYDSHSCVVQSTFSQPSISLTHTPLLHTHVTIEPYKAGSGKDMRSEVDAATAGTLSLPNPVSCA